MKEKRILSLFIVTLLFATCLCMIACKGNPPTPTDNSSATQSHEGSSLKESSSSSASEWEDENVDDDGWT